MAVTRFTEIVNQAEHRLAFTSLLSSVDREAGSRNLKCKRASFTNCGALDDEAIQGKPEWMCTTGKGTFPFGIGHDCQ